MCVQAHRDAGRVRFGFTVGKRNVPRSVDRALVKRIMREACRAVLPDVLDDCRALNIGADISLRFRAPLRIVAGKSTLAQARLGIRRSTDMCLRAVRRRLPEAAHALQETV